jgi:hypothetical protein
LPVLSTADRAAAFPHSPKPVRSGIVALKPLMPPGLGGFFLRNLCKSSTLCERRKTSLYRRAVFQPPVARRTNSSGRPHRSGKAGLIVDVVFSKEKPEVERDPSKQN